MKFFLTIHRIIDEQYDVFSQHLYDHYYFNWINSREIKFCEKKKFQNFLHLFASQPFKKFCVDLISWREEKNIQLFNYNSHFSIFNLPSYTWTITSFNNTRILMQTQPDIIGILRLKFLFRITQTLDKTIANVWGNCINHYIKKMVRLQ